MSGEHRHRAVVFLDFDGVLAGRRRTRTYASAVGKFTAEGNFVAVSALRRALAFLESRPVPRVRRRVAAR